MPTNTFVLAIILLFPNFFGTSANPNSDDHIQSIKGDEAKFEIEIQKESSPKTIHIIVALCDNKYQGIYPVPQALGNGQDPKNNLYWGALYGVKTHFKKSKEWKLLKQSKVDSVLMERLVFKHSSQDYYIIADAYNGKYIKEATKVFLRSSAGMDKDYIPVNGKKLGINGNAHLLAYTGHNGLMDFDVEGKFINTDKKKRDVIILACYSKDFFESRLEKANVNPLVWTTGLMAPEAYTTHDALSGYVLGENNEQIRLRAAKAYNKYQKCGLNGAKNLLVTQ